MAVENEDLGLTLSLGSMKPKPTTTTTTTPSVGPTTATINDLQRFNFFNPSNAFSSRSSDHRHHGSSLKGIDVNRPAENNDEEIGVSSPNSTVSTVSGKRSCGEREENEVERESSRGVSDEEDGGDNSRKKLRLSKDQSAILEESFKEHNTLNPKQKLALAKRLGLRPRQVEVWFQNRRARTKLKQTEVDCEFLKRCCEQLTEDNRRLQKEVAELRALKLSPQFYMQMTPPTTLTMCPSCERVATPAQHEARPTLAAHNRPIPVNPWVAPIRPFDTIKPRS